MTSVISVARRGERGLTAKTMGPIVQRLCPRGKLADCLGSLFINLKSPLGQCICVQALQGTDLIITLTYQMLCLWLDGTMEVWQPAATAK